MEARPPRRSLSPRRRSALLGAALAVVVGAAFVLWAASRQGRERPEPYQKPAAGPLNPRVTATIRVGPAPAGLALGEGGVCVGVPYGQTDRPCSGAVVRIDPATNEVAARIPVRGWVEDIAVGFGAVWAEGSVCADEAGREATAAVFRIDPLTNRIVATIRLGPTTGGGTADVGVGEGGVWVTRSRAAERGEVVRLDPATNRVVARIPLTDPRDVVVGEGGVWVFDIGLPPGAERGFGKGQRLVHIDPARNRVVATFTHTLAIGVGKGWTWMYRLLSVDESGLVRIDPRTDEVVGRPIRGEFLGFAAEHGTLGTLAVGEGGVWFRTRNRNFRGERGIFVARLHARTLRVGALVKYRRLPIEAALDRSTHTLWLVNYQGPVSRIDLRSS